MELQPSKNGHFSMYIHTYIITEGSFKGDITTGLKVIIANRDIDATRFGIVGIIVILRTMVHKLGGHVKCLIA